MSLLDTLTKKYLNLLLPLLAFLLPLFFLPNTIDFFNTNKQILLIVLSSLALVSWAFRQLIQRQFYLVITPSALPLLGLCLIALLSALIQHPNKLFALNGSVTTLISLTIIFLSLTSSLKSININSTLTALFLSLSLNSLFVIYQFTGLSARLSSSAWLASPAFNPLGGPLPYLTFALPLLPAMIYLAFKNSNSMAKISLFVGAGLTILASIICASLLLPKNGVPQLSLLPLDAGWAIAVDNFKNARSAILGVGPESFVNAFTKLRPLSVNRTAFWNIRFNYSSNEFLHILTVLGPIALALYVVALLRPLSLNLKQTNPALRLVLGLVILTHLLVPANITLTTLTFIILTLLSLDSINHSPNKVREVNVKSALPLVFFVLALLLVGANGYFRFRSYAAETYFYKSFTAARNNDGTQTYNLQIQALQNAPHDPKIRISYSQTNVALANTIAGKQNPTDQDKSNITQLIQQAIREAKAATVLDPQNPVTWQNLASIYRQLIGVAQDADKWTIAAYTQAVALDPLNPELRIQLGGVYFSLKNYDQAIRLFQQAIEAKNDLSNAYYNLSHAYLENKQYPQAIQTMRVVTQLLDPTSPDFQKAQSELNDLEKKYPQTKATDTPTESDSELVVPSPIPSPTQEPIQLPDGSGLNLPSPTPTPTE